VIPQSLLELELFDVTAARRAGVSDSELKRAARDGSLTRVQRGWYTAVGAGWTSDRHRLRVHLALRRRTNVVASHYSAAVHLGLPVHRPDWATVHLMRTGDGSSRSRPGLVIHQRVEHAEVGVALVVAQTALGCPVSGLMAADAALRADLMTVDDLRSVAAALSGRKGFGHLGVVLRLADGRRESPLESRTALTYDAWQLALEPQFRVPGTRYRADGRIVGTRVLVESDGKGKYDEPGALFREKQREDEVRSLDWELVRVTDELLDRPGVLLARTRKALRRTARRLA